MKTLTFPVPKDLRGTALEVELREGLGVKEIKNLRGQKVLPLAVSVGADGLTVALPDDYDDADVAAIVKAHKGKPHPKEDPERLAIEARTAERDREQDDMRAMLAEWRRR